MLAGLRFSVGDSTKSMRTLRCLGPSEQDGLTGCQSLQPVNASSISGATCEITPSTNDEADAGLNKGTIPPVVGVGTVPGDARSFWQSQAVIAIRISCFFSFETFMTSSIYRLWSSSVWRRIRAMAQPNRAHANRNKDRRTRVGPIE